MLAALSSDCGVNDAVHYVQDILIGNGKLTGPHSVKYDLPGRVDVGGTVTAKDIIIASGSVPFVPPGELFAAGFKCWWLFAMCCSYVGSRRRCWLMKCSVLA